MRNNPSLVSCVARPSHRRVLLQGECTGLAKASKFGTVSAAECAAALGELYPTVEYFTLDEATAELARHGDGHGDEDKDETTVTA